MPRHCGCRQKRRDLALVLGPLTLKEREEKHMGETEEGVFSQADGEAGKCNDMDFREEMLSTKVRPPCAENPLRQ